MINIIFGFYIFLEILSWVILIDVILSWLAVFGLNVRPKFVANLIDPLYSFIKKHITTTISAFDFTPIIVLLIIMLLQFLLMGFFPQLSNYIRLLG